ncbi:MAG: hypothetical protein RMK29_19860 [Myxococcales bacterium]|nr:YbjN domain-containing protein [Myxococcota bacterium]MDW8283965.1 hypothetical protein [Myxococcales bacterium]
MPTWEEICTHIRQRFVISVDKARWLGLTWRFGGPEGPVYQGQRVELAHAMGKPQVLILCDVVPEADLPLREALEHNMTLAIGALALSQGTFVLRQVYPADGLDFAQLDTALEFLAHEAARLRLQTTAARGLATMQRVLPDSLDGYE